MKSKKLASLVLSAVVCSSAITAYLPLSRVKADDTTSTLGQIKSYTTSRFAGADRFATSQAVATEFQKTENNGIILAFGLNFPDALSGSALSHKYKMPVLLVGSQQADIDNTVGFIENNVDRSKTIYILGGTAGISDSTVNGLSSAGYTSIKRLGGSDRYATNSKIVDELAPAQGTPVVIANGQNFPDALSISSIASAKGYPIILTSANSLSDEASNKIASIKPSKIYVIGGTGSVSDTTYNTIQSVAGLSSDSIVRIGGKDRYDTSLNIAKYFNPDSSTVTFANGSNFPDALSGSALSAQKNAPLILINNSDVSAQKQYIDSTGFTKEIIYGGEGSVSSDTEGLLSKSYDPNRDTLNADTGSAKTDIEPNQAMKIYSSKGFSQSDLSSITVTDSTGTNSEVTPSLSSDGKTITLTPNATFTDDTGTIKLPKNAYSCNTTYTVNIPGVSQSLTFKTRDYVLNPLDTKGLFSEDYLAEGDKYATDMWSIPFMNYTGVNGLSLMQATSNGSNLNFVNNPQHTDQYLPLSDGYNKFNTIQNKNMYNVQVQLRHEMSQLASVNKDYANFNVGFNQVPPCNTYNGGYVNYKMQPNIVNSSIGGLYEFNIYESGSTGNKIVLVGNFYDSNKSVNDNLRNVSMYEVLYGLFGQDYANDILNYLIAHGTGWGSDDSATFGGVKVISTGSTFTFSY